MQSVCRLARSACGCWPADWDRWRTLFEEAGYSTLAPDWPDDAATVEEANANPEVFAHKSVGQVADHFEDVMTKTQSSAENLDQQSAVLPLPFSALKSASPVIGNPANHGRAVPLTFDQFRYDFANAVSEEEAHELYATFAVPASGIPLFQAATANLNPWTEAKVDTKNPDRDRCWSSPGRRTTPCRGHRQRRLQTPEAQPGHHRNHRDPQPGSRAGDRQRLAGSRRHRSRLRPTVREAVAPPSRAENRPATGQRCLGRRQPPAPLALTGAIKGADSVATPTSRGQEVA